MSRRAIAVVSVSRADRAAAVAVADALSDHDQVAGTLLALEDPHDQHQLPTGSPYDVHRLPHQFVDDGPAAAAVRAGALTSSFAEAFDRFNPDFVVVAGDRFETHAAAVAALLTGRIIAHLHGGEITRGALDDPLRHAISKLSHLHFCATAQARIRLERMGEEPWRITQSGAPALDFLLARPIPDRAAFFASLGWADPGPFVLATCHPATARPEDTGADLEALLDALARLDFPVIFTGVNADPGAGSVNARIQSWSAGRPAVRVLAGLGPLYAGALTHAAAMVGNSSSGLIEAPSFGLPVVNIGSRQEGRDRGANVIDCPGAAEAVAEALKRALDPAFRERLASMANPYGDGAAAPRIAARLAQEPLSDELRMKRFPDLAPQGAGS